MTPRPLIAVPAMRSPKVAGLRRSGVVVAERIAESIYRAGGEPLSLFGGDESEADGRFGAFDGAVLPGGRDVDPRLYTDEPRHPRTDEPDEIQDAADIAAAGAVISVGLPTLAICRGFQVLNVALGGTLVQHLEPDPIDHANNELHEVDLQPGSRVAQAMGSTVVAVSSYHHQAVARIGADLVVVGRAGDGCVEVFEHVTAPVMGVQWHPEDNAQEAPEQQALFDFVVEQAGVFRTQRMAT